MTTGRHESCALWRYTAMVPTYDHRHAWKLRHCGVTPLRCKHMTTCMHGSCPTVALHRYGADIRPQACTKAAPLWRYAAVVQTYGCSLARASIRGQSSTCSYKSTQLVKLTVIRCRETVGVV